MLDNCPTAQQKSILPSLSLIDYEKRDIFDVNIAVIDLFVSNYVNLFTATSIDICYQNLVTILYGIYA